MELFVNAQMVSMMVGGRMICRICVNDKFTLIWSDRLKMTEWESEEAHISRCSFHSWYSFQCLCERGGLQTITEKKEKEIAMQMLWNKHILKVGCFSFDICVSDAQNVSSRFSWGSSIENTIHICSIRKTHTHLKCISIWKCWLLQNLQSRFFLFLFLYS